MQASRDIARIMRCPNCEAAYDAAGRCFSCGLSPRGADGGLIDVVGDAASPDSFGARAMQSRWLARIYESWWRPVAFALSTGLRMPTAEAEGALILGKLEGSRGPWLDLSCGPGHLTRRLEAHSGGRLVVAVDLSRAMLERVRINAPGAARVRADAARLPFADGAFGAVVNLAALDLYADAERAVRESVRVLGSGGRWIASTFVTTDRAKRSPWRSAAFTRAAGLRTPTAGALQSLATGQGLQRFASIRFGSYVVGWADKE